MNIGFHFLFYEGKFKIYRNLYQYQAKKFFTKLKNNSRYETDSIVVRDFVTNKGI